MVAHVGDFELARFLHQETDKSSGWAAMRGSIGYAAPGVLPFYFILFSYTPMTNMLATIKV